MWDNPGAVALSNPGASPLTSTFVIASHGIQQPELARNHQQTEESVWCFRSQIKHALEAPGASCPEHSQ